MNPNELIEHLSELGFDGVEWRFKEIPDAIKKESISFWGNNLCTISPSITDEEIHTLKTKSNAKDIEVISVTPYLKGDDLDDTEQVLKIANKFGAKYIRLGVPKYDRSENFHVLFDKCKRYLKDSEKLCKQYGIKGLVETHHNTIAASASAAYRLVEGLDPNYVGVLFDPGNMVHEGYENYRMGMELLGPYLAHVHIKNAIWTQDESLPNHKWKVEWELVDKGIVDWVQVIKDLKSVNYEGYIGVEDFSAKQDTNTTLAYNLEWLKKLKHIAEE